MLPEEEEEEDREALARLETEDDPYFLSQVEQSFVKPSLPALCEDSEADELSPGPTALQKHGAGGGLLHLQ